MEDSCSLCCRARGIWSSKTKWEGAGKMQLGLLDGAQRDGERQQQELKQGKFPVNARTNHDATMKVLKYWNRGLETGGNLCPWKYSDLDWSSLLGARLGGSRDLHEAPLPGTAPWSGERVPPGVGGLQVGTTQVGQARVGTGILAFPFPPLLQP